jgi:hypothetical protein
MRSGIECLKRNRENSHLQPLPARQSRQNRPGQTSRCKHSTEPVVKIQLQWGLLFKYCFYGHCTEFFNCALGSNLYHHCYCVLPIFASAWVQGCWEVPYVVGLCCKGTPQASQAGSCSMPRPTFYTCRAPDQINIYCGQLQRQSDYKNKWWLGFVWRHKSKFKV